MISGTATDEDAESVENELYDLPSTAARPKRYIYSSKRTSGGNMMNLPMQLGNASFLFVRTVRVSGFVTRAGRGRSGQARRPHPKQLRRTVVKGFGSQWPVVLFICDDA